MYDIALSVAACVRSGTRADVAWMIGPRVTDEAIAFTPGGGRMGSLARGAFDSLLQDVANRQLSAGRLVHHTVTEIESDIGDLAVGSEVTFLVVPAEQFPPDIWPALLEHASMNIIATLDDDVVTDVHIAPASEPGPAAIVAESTITTVLSPIPRLLIAGQGPIADALAAQGTLIGWRVAIEPRPDAVVGVAATLSAADAVVVMGHDVETSSSSLMAALGSAAGYIGALGSESMQQARAEWLSYRDVMDVSRVHGPAGLDIGAKTPAEIAVSIVAEIIESIR
jgi:xanthine dehydrogenase accessory factor